MLFPKVKTQSGHPEPKEWGRDNCTEDRCGDRALRDREREWGRQKASGVQTADVNLSNTW